MSAEVESPVEPIAQTELLDYRGKPAHIYNADQPRV